MDRAKFFWLTRRYHVIDNPLSETKLDEVIDVLRLRGDARVLDIACGKAEMLCRIANQYAAHCTGVERSAYICEEAEEKVRQRGLTGLVNIRQMDGQDFEAPEASFDVAMCIGAEWVFGGLKGTLARIGDWTKPGGAVLVGTPFWSSPPDRVYLGLAGLSAHDFSTHEGNVRAGEDLGLSLTYTAVSNHDDWDHYSGLAWSTAHDYISEHPGDPDATEIVELTRKDKAAYFGGGRDCLGWSIYVYRK